MFPNIACKMMSNLNYFSLSNKKEKFTIYPTFINTNKHQIYMNLTAHYIQQFTSSNFLAELSNKQYLIFIYVYYI